MQQILMRTWLIVWIAGGVLHPATADAAPARLLEGLGRALALHFQKYLPAPSAKVIVDPRGGPYCDVLKGLGWPPPIYTSDQINPKLQRAILGALQHGATYCGWKPG